MLLPGKAGVGFLHINTTHNRIPRGDLAKHHVRSKSFGKSYQIWGCMV